MPSKALQLREWRADRKRKDLCLECPKPARLGLTTCGEHPSRAGSLRLWRETKKEAGICVDCSRRAAKGRTLCQYHLDKLKAAYKKRSEGRRTRRGLCVRCRNGTPALPRSSFCQKHKEEAAAEHRLKDFKKREALKIEVLEAYGGCRCVCCGDEHIEWLSLEHPNNDGAAHRRRLLHTLHVSNRCGHKFYFKLKQLGFPRDVEMVVLCLPCQQARTRGTKICPHEKERQAKLRFAQGMASYIRTQNETTRTVARVVSDDTSTSKLSSGSERLQVDADEVHLRDDDRAGDERRSGSEEVQLDRERLGLAELDRACFFGDDHRPVVLALYPGSCNFWRSLQKRLSHHPLGMPGARGLGWMDSARN